MKVIEVFTNNINFGLKSTNVSLSIIPALRPGLINDLKNWALALNFSLLIIPDTQLNYYKPILKK
jgi:hypothetical protein